MRLLKLLEAANGFEQYSDIWTTATTFLEEKGRTLDSLPETSPEKLLAQALLGIFYKYRPNPDGDASSQIQSLVAELQPMVKSNDGELATYIHGTVEGLQRLASQIPASIDDGLGLDDPEGGDEEAGGGAGPEDTPKPKPEEEPEPSEKDQLASKLGLRDSYRRPRLISLTEQIEYQPGQTVTIIRDGKVIRRQVTKVNDRRVTVLDPDNPSDNAEVDIDELGTDDQDDSFQNRLKPLR